MKCKVVRINMFHLEPHPGIYRLLMKRTVMYCSVRLNVQFAEILLFWLVQMKKPFSTEHRTFFLYYILGFGSPFLERYLQYSLSYSLVYSCIMNMFLMY